ncbi:MAG: FliH/SctL family protein, partial [Oscillospiraceae bacterium]
IPTPARAARPPAPADGADGEGRELQQPGQDAEISSEAGGYAAPGEPMNQEIIQSAMAEASRLLENALREAEDTRGQMLDKVRQEGEEIRQAAAEQGRREGFTSVVGEMQQVADRLEQAVASFEGERAGFEAEYEEQLKWLAIEIASKVLAKRVSQDDTEMLEMVDKAVQSVRSEPWVRVEVAQEMVRLIDRLTELYAEQANIEVSPIPAAPGTVHIEMPSGVVDASLRTQLANLRDYFATNLTEN